MAHLTIEQRYTISVLLSQGKSISFIAQTISKSRSVVHREIRRNSSPTMGSYDYLEAQQLSELRQKQKRHHRRLTPQIIHYIQEMIRQDYSPEQVVGRAKLEGIPCVSITTIYKYIWDEKASPYTSDKLFHHLREGCHKALKKFGKRSGLGVIPDRVMIHERPEIIEKRTRFGDFEADTVWIAHKAVIVTVNDRTTGISHIRHLANRKSDNVNQAIYEMLSPYKDQIKSLTVDNGKEFYKHKELSLMLGCPIYFADPYASWQRGSNENVNKLYRQYFPRKTDFYSLSSEYIQMIENRLNSRPRKRLNYLSPFEFYYINFVKNQLLHLQL